MPKLGMQPIRRRQLIDATIRTIEAHGFAETTIARISKAAGLSSGIISHYFGGKNALLAATMRALLSELQAAVITRLRRAQSPIARIEAVIDASFSTEQFTPRVSTAWLAFYGQVPHSPELARLHRAYLGRLRSNLRHAFRQLLGPDEADRAAEGMGAMIDGIWVRSALRRQIPDMAHAHALADDYLRMILKYHRNPGTAEASSGARAQPDGGLHHHASR